METKGIWQKHKISILTAIALVCYGILLSKALSYLDYWRTPEYDGFFAKGDRREWLVEYRGLINLVLVSGFFQILLMAFFFQRRKEAGFSGTDKVPSATDFYIKVGSTMDLLIIAVLLVGLIFWLIKKYESADITVSWLINAALICVGAAIIYKYLAPYLSKSNVKLPAILTLLKQIALYIPCLVLRLVDWVRHQYKITTKPVWILLGVEVVLIVSRFLVPWLMDKLLNHKNKTLLKGPVYLDKEHPIGTYDELHKGANIEMDGPFSYNYAISGWFYLNPQPPSASKAASEDTPILDYGGKPTVFYNGRSNMLTVTMQKAKGKHVDDGARTIHLLKGYKMPLQKWNHIVLNMKGGSLDIFINGELVMAGAEAVPNLSYDNLVVGQSNGVQGAVANVQYYKEPMSLTQISLAYKSNSWKTPIV